MRGPLINIIVNFDSRVPKRVWVTLEQAAVLAGSGGWLRGGDTGKAFEQIGKELFLARDDAGQFPDVGSMGRERNSRQKSWRASHLNGVPVFSLFASLIDHAMRESDRGSLSHPHIVDAQ